MHAICSNEITCAAPGCHQPGTIVVAHVEEPQILEGTSGRKRILEGCVVLIEYCERHAPKDPE